MIVWFKFCLPVGHQSLSNMDKAISRSLFFPLSSSRSFFFPLSYLLYPKLHANDRNNAARARCFLSSISNYMPTMETMLFLTLRCLLSYFWKYSITFSCSMAKARYSSQWLVTKEGSIESHRISGTGLHSFLVLHFHRKSFSLLFHPFVINT